MLSDTENPESSYPFWQLFSSEYTENWSRTFHDIQR